MTLINEGNLLATVIGHDLDLNRIRLRHEAEDAKAKKAAALDEARRKRWTTLLWTILGLVGASTLERLLEAMWNLAHAGHL